MEETGLTRRDGQTTKGQGDQPAQPREMFVLGRHLSRRDVLRLSGGVVGLMAVQALLAACGGSNGGNGASEPTAGSGGGSPTPTDAAPSPTVPGGASTTDVAKVVNPGGTPPEQPEGELRVAIQFDPVSLDPIDTYSLNNGRWQSNVFSPLVWRDTDLVLYDGQDGRPAPSEGFGLAESWDYLDDKTLQVKLRSGVTFHDGSPFDAESVKSTFERMLDPDNQSPQRSNYTAIDSVEVVDSLTVKIHFHSVDPVMVTKLSGYGAFITPTSAVENDQDFSTTKAIGTGPYKVVEYVKDDHLTLEAWDDYWGSQKPHIRRIVYRIIPDDNTRLSEFLAGSIDVLTLNISQAEAAQGNPNVQVLDIGVPTVSGLRLDAKQAPTDNKDIRLAIAHAIDQQAIVDTILGGYAKPVGVWQSPFSFGYDEISPYEYDPELSKQLIEKSGLPTPIKLTYDVIGSSTQAKEIANAVKDMLGAVGFDVEIRLREQATYYDDYRAGKLGNIVPFGWGGWTLDYDNTYFLLYYTSESYNPSYSNPEVDRLLEEGRNTLDQARRLEIAKEVNKILYDDAPDVMLYQEAYLWGVSNRVKNFTIPPDERLWWLTSWVED